MSIANLCSRIDELERRLRRRDTFLALLGHELRNPLAAIEAALAARRAGSRNATETFELVERHLPQIRRLANDLFDLPQIERGRLRVERRRVVALEVLVEALELARPDIDSRGHELEVELPDERMMLDVDPVRIQEVVVNLLSNAARYTDPPGRIALSLRRKGRKAVLCVQDSGIGIDADRLPTLFDIDSPFDLPRDGRGSPRGLGLGLYLVRTIVELHGGRVEAASAGPGRGSTFRVELPLAARRPRRTRALAGRRWRILLVDDDRDCSESLARLLERAGHEARIAPSGEVALREIGRLDPELVLIDVKLPGLDGWEIARHLRALPGGERRTLIAVTGDGSPSSEQRSREAGCDGHLLKPLDVDRLEALLARIRKPR